MNTANSPFFHSLVCDSARRERAARFAASRMAAAADGQPGRSSFADWCEWTTQILGAARAIDPPLSEVVRGAMLQFGVEFVHAADCEGLVFPHVANQATGGLRRGQARSALLSLEGDVRTRDADAVRDLVYDHGFEHAGCEHCGYSFLVDDMQSTHDDGLVCESCRDDYRYSDYSDRWIPEHNAVEARGRNGRMIWIHEDEDDFHFCEDRGEYVHDDYEPPAPPSIIREYHHSKPYFVARDDAWTRQFNRMLGVELEVECHTAEPREAAQAIHEFVNGGEFGRSIFFERDGSLTNGFEMISQPMSLPALRGVFGFLNDSRLVAGLRSHRTTTCGLHVHVSRSGLSNLTIARANVFVNDPQNDAFITAIARRYNARFCLVSEKQLETAHISADRYEAINLTGRTTIEFRIFRGSLKFEAVVAAVEFAHALLEFCARTQTGATSLNARAFLAFCAKELRDDTAILREYVAARTAGVFSLSEAA